jgi:2,4-dienoyl-CoA reductase (NADPH2)
VTYRRIADAGLHITVDGRETLIPADTVIVCAGQEPRRALAGLLRAADEMRAGELDAKRAMLEGAELAAAL